MKKLDPYKRLILFLASAVNVCLMTVIFAYVWYRFYSKMMFVVSFYRRGNYAVLALYALLLFFFFNTYGSLKIGQLRRVEILLSQYLGLFLTNVIAYFIISLLAFRMVSIRYLLVAMLVEMVVSAAWNIVIIKLYNRIFQPWKILLVYGERPAVELFYKVETRRDKYAIYDAVNIDEGMPVIADMLGDFQAVIIGDISAEKRNALLKYCYAHKIRTYLLPKISDILMMGADHIHIFDTPFLLFRGYTLSVDQRIIKRTLDLCLVIPIFLLFSPVMLLTAIAIKLDDGGPVLYKQTRCTRHEEEFQIYKFRSMVVDAEEDGVAVLAKEHDARITRVGRIIRRMRIDELPQLLNILQGKMSFVGPRPERPEIIREYSETMPEFPFRNRVKAGLTGFAQIYGKYNTTPYDKLKLDLFYIANYSVWTDIKLILMTVKTIFIKEATEGVDDSQTTAEMVNSGENVEKVVREVMEMENRKH